MKLALGLVVLLAGCGSSDDVLFVDVGVGGAGATSSSAATGSGGASVSSSSSTSSAVTSTSSGTSSSSTGGCTSALHCGNDAPCAHPTCTGGVCGVVFPPLGMTVPGQVASDCQLAVCDGAGSVTSEPDDADIADDGNDCTVDACASGTPTHTLLAKGTACAGGLCDGVSACAAFLPVLCDTGAMTYSACDGADHTYAIAYVDAWGGGANSCQLAGNIGYCPTGNDCTVHTNNGMHLDGVCQ